MRDLYAPFFRSRRPPETPETEGTAFEAQVRDAFPRPAVSDALQARVAEACSLAAAPESQDRWRAARNRRRWMRTARWGTLGVAATALAIVWLSGRREMASMQAPVATAPPRQADHSAPPTSSAPARRTWASGSLAGGKAAAHGSVTQDADERFLASIPEGEVAEGADAEPSAKPRTLTALQESRPDRYLIRNATLTLEVRDPRQASRALIAAVGGARGYVSDTHESVDELGRRSAVITVRVPFGQFDGALEQIEALGKVQEKQVTAEDVTEEFVDSQAKRRNLQRTELRLLAHLDHSGRLPDILLVEKELNRVRGEIEQLEGRLRYLAHRIAYSTLAVTLSEAPRPQAVVPPETYSSGKVASDAMRSLVAFGQVVWSGAIWIAIWAVVWVPLALAAWLAYRRRVGVMR